MSDRGLLISKVRLNALSCTTDKHKVILGSVIVAPLFGNLNLTHKLVKYHWWRGFTHSIILLLYVVFLWYSPIYWALTKLVAIQMKVKKN